MALANCCLQIGSSGFSTNTNTSFEELTSSGRTLDDEPSCEMFIFSSCCSMGDETSFVRFIDEGTLSKKFASSSCFVIEETPFEKFTSSYSLKLNSSNYPIWKAQALSYFRGQVVFCYLDGAMIKIPNPHYLQWLHQDSLILATINASLTKDVLTQAISYTTSREVWLALELTFSSISCAKAIQIRAHLANA
ncbi:hypothetical protein AAG906_011479 [Vitis piasezkii]